MLIRPLRVTARLSHHPSVVFPAQAIMAQRGRVSFGGLGAPQHARGFSHSAAPQSAQPVNRGPNAPSAAPAAPQAHSGRGSCRGGHARGRGRGGYHSHEEDEAINWDLVMPPKDQIYDIVDIGANLGHKRFARDWQQVVDQATVAGVKQIILTGTSVRDSIRVLDLARQKPGVLYCTAGVHPHDAKSCDESTIQTLRDLASHPEVVAVGECGLDFDRMFSPADVQIKWFEEQIKLAIELKKLMFLHERSASEAFLKVLRSFPRDQLPRLCVHCFTGDTKELKQYLEFDCYIGITGWINDNNRGRDLQRAVKHIPLNRLMIETDAPFLAPKDIPNVRISRNEPGVLPHVLRKVAECVGQPVDVVAAATLATTKEFFNLP